MMPAKSTKPPRKIIVGIRVAPDLKARIDAAAARDARTFSWWANKALEEKLARDSKK